jgi:hypothetical protein
VRIKEGVKGGHETVAAADVDADQRDVADAGGAGDATSEGQLCGGEVA